MKQRQGNRWTRALRFAQSAIARLTTTRRQQQFREESEALTTGVIDASPQAIVVTDSNGRIVRTNRRVEELFGYQPQSLIGQSVDMLLPVGQRERHVGLRRSYDYTARAMGSRTNLLARHASGREFHVQVHLSPLRLGDQTLVVAGVLDVSVEYHALQNLKASEARWKQLANSMPQLVWTCTDDGNFDFVSSQWLTYTGQLEAEQFGASWLDQIHPGDQQEMRRRWQMAVLSKQTFHVDFRIRRRDGVYRWFDTQAVPQLIADGQVQRWIGTNTDIEDRKRAEDSLRELNATLEARVDERTAALEAAQRDLRNIIDAMPSKVSYWDSDLRNRFANRVYYDWFGVEASKIPGMHMRELLGDEVFARRRPYINAALAGNAQSFHDPLPRMDGNGIRHAAVRYIPDVVDGKVRGFYAHSSDISELRVATDQAKAANTAKTAFLANMSHEIRTPMNAVINLTYLLEHTDLQFEQRDLVDKIKIASRSLLGVINDILDLSKIEAGQMRVISETFALHPIVDDVIGLMSAQAATKRIDLSVRIADDVPAYVNGDGLRISQILSNLVSNAIKFTDLGTVRLEVTRDTASADPACIRFVIEDTGIGIAPDMLEKLFRPFSQVDESTTRRHGGTGLGLAIVRRLAELMGGQVGAESAAGIGSRFWFSVPLNAQTDESHTPEGSPRDDILSRPVNTRTTTHSVGPRLTGARVLLVDDSAINLEVGRRILEREGALVAVASDGQQAVDRLRLEPEGYDIVLMDVQMPGLDGHEASRRIRNQLNQRDLPIVALTAGALLSERERAMEAGMNEFISKPFDADAMIALVSKLLKRKPERLPNVEAPAVADMAWPVIEGINSGLAQSQLIGDVGLFKTSVHRLLDEYADFETALDPQANPEAASELMRRAHKLRGIAGMLGAVTLQRLATELETALRERPTSSVVTALEELAGQLARIRQSFSNLPAEPERIVSMTAKATVSDADLEQLRTLLQKQSLDAVDLFARLRNDLATILNPTALADLDQSIENLGFAEALRILNSSTRHAKQVEPCTPDGIE